MITSSVVCYRAALHRRRSSTASIAQAAAASAATTATGGCISNQTGPGPRDWCILSFNYRRPIIMCSSSDVVPPPPTTTTNRRLNRRSSSPTSSSSNSSSTESRTIVSSGLAVKSPSNSLKSIGGGLDHNISLSSKNSLESISGHRRHRVVATANPSPVQSLESLQQCDDNDNFVSNSPRHSNSSSSSSSSSNSTSTHFKCRKALGILFSYLKIIT